MEKKDKAIEKCSENVLQDLGPQFFKQIMERNSKIPL